MGNDNRNVKVIAILALLVAVVGVSIGFAAFSRTLTIYSGATVNPTNTFNVVFSKVNNAVDATGVASATSNPAGLTLDTPIINNSAANGPEITNLKATFTEPGQSATFTFYAYNDSSYEAFLRSVDFTAAQTKCASVSATTGLMNAACNDVNVKISVGSDVNTQNLTADTSVSSHSLAAGSGELITVVISYDQVASQTLVDGAFTVDLGTIQLIYRTVDAD